MTLESLPEHSVQDPQVHPLVVLLGILMWCRVCLRYLKWRPTSGVSEVLPSRVGRASGLGEGSDRHLKAQLGPLLWRHRPNSHRRRLLNSDVLPVLLRGSDCRHLAKVIVT